MTGPPPPSATPAPAPAQEGLHGRTEALLRRLVRREAAGALKKVLARTAPADLAAVMEHLTWAEQRRLYRFIDDVDYAAEVVAHLSEESSREVLRDLTEEHLAGLVERMEVDDATDLLATLPEELRARVLEALPAGEETQHVRDLLAWPPDTAGGLMSPAVVRMPDTATCGQAISVLQANHSRFEIIYYVYVVNTRGQLVGVCSLRELLSHSPRTPLVKFMTREVVNVRPEQDQEEVARFVARYDLLAIPVVGEGGQLLGAVTVDDVVDVIREEAAEDMLRMAGVAEEPHYTSGVFRQARVRAGWLLATILGGVLAAEIIAGFEGTLTRVAVLAGFIPVIMGMGGNVGIQSATLAVRGLATGAVQVGGRRRFVWTEARVGVLLGGLYAGLLGAYAVMRYPSQPAVAASVAASVLLAIGLASVVGASLPIGFARLGVDPAVATGPFVTTAVDVLGIVVYFAVATLFLGL